MQIRSIFQTMVLMAMSVVGTGFSSAVAQSFGPNEVSQLLPLPSPTEMNLLLAPISAGARGELLPASVYRFLPLLSDRADQDNLYRYNLKVIGVRFDPCFGEGVNPGRCRPQIRFVWQPLVVVGEQVTTLDTAIHTFHEFSDNEWATIVSELRWMVTSSYRYPLDLPLDIQPNLRAEGFTGSYWKKLSTLLLAHCGEQNLIRVTAMTVRMNRVWHFMGLDRTATGWSMIKIPTLDLEPAVTSQSFFLQPEGLENLEEFNGGISYLPKSERSFMRLTSGSERFRELEKEPAIKAVIRRAIQLENPRLHNPGTADCVSCHLAQTVRLWGEKNFPKWDWNREFANDRFPSSMQNRSVNPFQTDRMRAFGYFGHDPILAQRVIHETKLVVDSVK
jgi:hypothetical protein